MTNLTNLPNLTPLSLYIFRENKKKIDLLYYY